jgi:dienelactone hydrolase
MREYEVAVVTASTILAGSLSVEAGASGIVVFAHGTGSSRHSPRNRAVARRLNENGFATLLLDLLTREEEEADERGADHRFDITLLARRLDAAMRWAHEQRDLENLPIGLFGASTGAAAALVAASSPENEVNAIVSRGGRPDLAGLRDLERVRAPVMLIVGGLDKVVLGLNEQAQESLGSPSRLEIVEGATHLFEEPGALEIVAELAVEWFGAHLRSDRAPEAW